MRRMLFWAMVAAMAAILTMPLTAGAHHRGWEPAGGPWSELYCRTFPLAERCQ